MPSSAVGSSRPVQRRSSKATPVTVSFIFRRVRHATGSGVGGGDDRGSRLAARILGRAVGPNEPGEETGETEASPRHLRLFGAFLWCENCGTMTDHRILRTAPASVQSPEHLSGTARCRRCKWTHRFAVRGPSVVEIGEVVSEGPRSIHQRLLVPRTKWIALGRPLPGSPELATVRRIETRAGMSVSSARPEDVATVWVTRGVGTVVPVSVVEGARTWTDRLLLPRRSQLTVGETLQLRGETVRVVALRARGKTWRFPEESFHAPEVQRVYARRSDMPPAGSQRWSTGRGNPSSRARVTSTSERSRSGPGVKRKKTFPRDRIADGGATTHKRSPP